MVDLKRTDSTRDLLEEIEDGWATPQAPAVRARGAAEAPADEAEEREALPDVDAIDEGWLDDLFPEQDDDDDDEEPEPELPDERVDPVAFAAAKQAREERQAARKDRKKAKLEAKRARQRAKAAAMRQKQKGKKAKAPTRPAPKPAKVKKPARAAAAPNPKSLQRVDDEAARSIEEPDDDAIMIPGVATANRAKTVASVKLLAIVLVVLVAVGALVAALVK